MERLRNIETQLLGQVGNAVESLCITQPGHEIDLDRCIVQVAREADQMHFNFTRLLGKSGVGSDIARRWPGFVSHPCPHRIHPVSGNEGF